MERRELIQLLVAGAAVQGLEAAGPPDLLALGRDAHAQGPAGALNAGELRTVTAAAEIILPRTDTPGAAEAGVAAFIDRMMAGWYAAADKERFVAGLRDLDARAMNFRIRTFVRLTQSDQVALLTDIDGEVTALRAADGARANAHWFAMLKYLTIWGYCTSRVGAQALGLDQPAMRYDGNAPVGGG